MIFDYLMERLEERGIAIRGQTAFEGNIPVGINVAVMFRLPLQGIKTSQEMIGHHRGEFQVITRHHDVVAGQEMALAVSRALVIQSRVISPANALRGELHIDNSFPQTMPIRFPALEGGGHEWSQYFDVVFGLQPSWM